MGEYGASASDVKAETIWFSPAVDTTTGQPFGGDDGVGGYAPLAVVAGGAVNWVYGNHLGVPIVVTDSAGNLTAPSGYTRVGFPGQTQTLDDLYYNRYRDYDPTIGRYIQADPIGLDGGRNPYAYADGNPIRKTDPLGLQSTPAGEVIDFALEWWLRRQVRPGRATPWGRAIGIGEAIGATAAVGIFLYNRHCEQQRRDHDECDLERTKEEEYCERKFSPVREAVRRCYNRAQENYLSCRRGGPGLPWWSDYDEDGVRIPTRPSRPRRF